MKLIQNNKGQFVKVPLTPEEIAALQPTPYELAMQDWDCPEFDYRVEVPSDLGGAYPDIVAHAICNPNLIRIVPINGICRIYFNKLKPNHDGIVKSLKLEPVPRPDKSNY